MDSREKRPDIKEKRHPEFKARLLNFFDGSISQGDSTRPGHARLARATIPSYALLVSEEKNEGYGLMSPG